MSLLLKVLILALGAYLLLCGLIYLGQRRLLYFPGPPPRGTLETSGLQGRAIELVTEDGEYLEAWLLEADEARGVVLVSHGNAGNLEDRLFLARAFVSLGLSVFLYDYRGYGNSSGSPSEEGTYRDARAAYDWLIENGFAAERVLLYGESLGGGVSVELATEVVHGGLVLDHTFTSVPDIGAGAYPWLPVRLLARDRYDNLAKIGSVPRPTLIVHSPEDEIIPFEHSRQLLRAAPPGTAFLTTQGGHNDAGIVGKAEYLEALDAFVERAFARD